MLEVLHLAHEIFLFIAGTSYNTSILRLKHVPYIYKTNSALEFISCGIWHAHSIFYICADIDRLYGF